MTQHLGQIATKAAANLAKHSVAFGAVERFEWETACVQADTRQFYGEVRMVVHGIIEGRVHALVFTIRKTRLWIISLRKANNREILRYASEDHPEHA